MLLDCALGDHEPLGDRPVRASFSHQGQYLPLAVAQVVDRVMALAAAADELGHDGGIEHRSALADALDRVRKVVEIRDAVLEQVADPASVIGKQLEGVARPYVLGEDDYAQHRVAAAELARRTQSFVRVRRRHADVDDGDVGLLLGHFAEQLVGIARLSDDLEAGLDEQARHALPKEE